MEEVIEEVKKEEKMSTPEVDTEVDDSKSEFVAMLKSNKAFQSEFDRRLSQSLETAKDKWQKEYDAKLNELTKAKETS
jgi:hypothetical protein